MGSAAISIGTITYGIGTLSFLVLLFPLAKRVRRMEGALMLAAAAATTLWMAAAAIHHWGAWDGARLVSALEILRTVAWIVFLANLLLSGSARRRKAFQRYYLPPIAALVLAGLAAAVVLPGDLLVTSALTPSTLVGLGLAIVGLMLTEVLFRQTPADERWQIKFLCIATGIIYAFDLFLYADANLFGRVDPVLEAARGAVQALTAPLFAVAAARNRIWQTRIALSRRIVLGSTTLISSGLYLTIAAAIGYLLREVDETRGLVVQVVFFVGAVVVLAIVLFSGTYWAHAKIFINKHFFRQKYDWREEWLRFMRTISSGQSAAPLEERCVKAIADIVDSPGGAMWLLTGGRCECVCEWNFSVPGLNEEMAGELARYLGAFNSIVDLESPPAGFGAGQGAATRGAIEATKPARWMVPLWHRSLVGFVVLARPRAPRVLDREDYDLLGVAGRHAASHISEQKVMEALEQAHEFEIFNRRFAFVVHDVKNLVSQLSVLGSNFEKHGHRKEFRDDVVSTLNDAADKMRRLMQRIHSLEPSAPNESGQRLVPLIRRVVSSHEEAHIDLDLGDEGANLTVLGDRDRLEAVIEHLVSNAVEAVERDGTVTVALRKNGHLAIVDIVDNGPGMERDFIRRELFTPFQSTKREGMGLGAFQCREFARLLGGNLEAISAPGRGTTMRVSLPIVETGASL